jgi:hypothetical protein
MTPGMGATVTAVVVLALSLARPLGAQRLEPDAMTPAPGLDVSAALVVAPAGEESCIGLRVKTATVYPVAFAAAGYVAYLFTLGFTKQTHIRQKFIWGGAAVGALYGTAHAIFADCSDLPPRRRRRPPPP